MQHVSVCLQKYLEPCDFLQKAKCELLGILFLLTPVCLLVKCDGVSRQWSL
jgi:hypothetical protein